MSPKKRSAETLPVPGITDEQRIKIKHALTETAESLFHLTEAQASHEKAEVVLSSAEELVEQTEGALEKAQRGRKDAELHAYNVFWTVFSEHPQLAPDEQSYVITEWLRLRQNGDYELSPRHAADVDTFNQLAYDEPVLSIKNHFYDDGVQEGQYFVAKGQPALALQQNLSVVIPRTEQQLQGTVGVSYAIRGRSNDIAAYDVDGLSEDIIVGKENILRYLVDEYEPFDYKEKPDIDGAPPKITDRDMTMDMNILQTMHDLDIAEEGAVTVAAIEKSLVKNIGYTLGLRKKDSSTHLGMEHTWPDADKLLKDSADIMKRVGSCPIPGVGERVKNTVMDKIAKKVASDGKVEHKELLVRLAYVTGIDGQDTTEVFYKAPQDMRKRQEYLSGLIKTEADLLKRLT